MQQMNSKDYSAANAILRGVLDDPDFAALPEQWKMATYAVAASAAFGDEDVERGWVMLDKANASPLADDELAEATLDQAIETWRPEKALAVLSILAAHRPAKLRELDDIVVYQMYGALKREHASDSDRIRFLQAFFDADRMLQDGRQPNALWLDLAQLKLTTGDVPAAVIVARRITGADELLALQIDRRFDPVVATIAPAQLDLAVALEREIGTLSATVAKEPRTLQNVVELTYVLLAAGRYEQLLATCDEVIAKAAAAKGEPAYDDADDALVWIQDNRARGLIALGRVDEAIEVWEAARRMPEAGGDNVSQAINIAQLYAALGRTAEALRALETVKEASPFGWMQYHATRYRALIATPDDPLARESLAFVREHHADAPGTYVEVLMHAGAMDEASAAFRARLDDLDDRANALRDAQAYRAPPLATPYSPALGLMSQLVARPEVRTAVDTVGRQLQLPLPLYRMQL